MSRPRRPSPPADAANTTEPVPNLPLHILTKEFIVAPGTSKVYPPNVQFSPATEIRLAVRMFSSAKVKEGLDIVLAHATGIPKVGFVAGSCTCRGRRLTHTLSLSRTVSQHTSSKGLLLPPNNPSIHPPGPLPPLGHHLGRPEPFRLGSPKRTSFTVWPMGLAERRRRRRLRYHQIIRSRQERARCCGIGALVWGGGTSNGADQTSLLHRFDPDRTGAFSTAPLDSRCWNWRGNSDTADARKSGCSETCDVCDTYGST
jgi:hypothetical protein